MVKLIILFRAGLRSTEHAEQYNNFLMSLEALPGVRRKSVSNVYSAPGGLVPFRDVIELYFDTRAALEQALTSQPGMKAGNLLLDFAGPDAVTLFAEVMEEDLTTPAPQ
jgi:uncharacterized protein (TIGR02118 family)